MPEGFLFSSSSFFPDKESLRNFIQDQTCEGEEPFGFRKRSRKSKTFNKETRKKVWSFLCMFSVFFLQFYTTTLMNVFLKQNMNKFIDVVHYRVEFVRDRIMFYRGGVQTTVYDQCNEKQDVSDVLKLVINQVLKEMHLRFEANLKVYIITFFQLTRMSVIQIL